MTDQHDDQWTELPAEQSPELPLSTSDFSEVLLLLASTREQVEQLRTDYTLARSAADRSQAEADSLRSEIDGMTSSLVGLEGKVESLESIRSRAESRISELEHQLVIERERMNAGHQIIAGLEASLVAARKAEGELQAGLDDVYRSTSWKLTKPIRAMRDGVSRHR